MSDALTQVYFCHAVLSRTDISPLLTGPFEGEMHLVETLIGLSGSIDVGYDNWCQVNGSDNFCAVFDYEVTPVVAHQVADFMLDNRCPPAGSLVTQWTVRAMYAANEIAAGD